MNKLTLWNDPIGHIKFYFQIHFASIHVCGSWFGVRVYPNGKVVFVNDELVKVVEGCMKPVEEGAK